MQVQNNTKFRNSKDRDGEGGKFMVLTYKRLILEENFVHKAFESNCLNCAFQYSLAKFESIQSILDVKN